MANGKTSTNAPRGVIYLKVASLRSAGPQRDLGDLGELEESIQSLGLIQPLVVSTDLSRVVAGRRRLEAVRQLGWDEVPCWPMGDGDEITEFRIALHENLQRRPLSDPENASWIAQYHELMQQLRPPTQGRRTDLHPSDSDRGWSRQDTASALGISTGLVSMAIRIEDAVRRRPRLAEFSGHVILRTDRVITQKERALRDIKKLGLHDFHFVLGDAREEVVAGLEDRSVALLVTDPPYGIEYESGSNNPQMSGGIEGDDQSAPELLSEVLEAMMPKLTDQAHAYIFCKLGRSYDMLRPVVDQFFTVRSHIVWVKGTSGPGFEWWAPTTEIIIFGTRGDPPRRLFGRRFPDHVIIPRLPETKRIHPTQKPLKLLRILIRRSSTRGELVADPFAGSGATLVAARQTERRYWGSELSEIYYRPALRRVHRARVLSPSGSRQAA